MHINRFERMEDWYNEFLKLINNNDLYFAFFFQSVELLRILFSDKSANTIYEINRIDVLDIIKTKDFSSTTYDNFVKILPKIKHAKKFWFNVIIDYKNKLNDLIKNAPKTTKQMIVWRGDKIDVFTKDDKKDKTYTCQNFMSTTLDISMHEAFRKPNCCMKCIIIPKGTSCLYAAGFSKEFSENEILFASNATFKIIGKVNQEITYRPYSMLSLYPSSFLCKKDDLEQVKITKMKFVKYD